MNNVYIQLFLLLQYIYWYLFFIIRTTACGLLRQPTNGELRVVGTGENAEAFYKCHWGYRLRGHSLRTCLRNGSWTFTDPVCEGIINAIKTVLLRYVTLVHKLIGCGALPVLQNGEVHLLTRHGYGATVHYVCNVGYVLNTNSSRRVCQEDGLWSGSDPTCEGE